MVKDAPKKNDYQYTHDYSNAMEKYNNDVRSGAVTPTASYSQNVIINVDTSKVKFQSTDYDNLNTPNEQRGEYPGRNGCISSTIAAMFRINDGAEGAAKDLVESDDDGSNPRGGKQGYTYTKINLNKNAKDGNGISQDEALEAIKNELAHNKVCGVKVDNHNSEYGHTIICSGVANGKSLADATWSDLLFNDVGLKTPKNREARTLADLGYEPPKDGSCYVVIDTTQK